MCTHDTIGRVRAVPLSPSGWIDEYMSRYCSLPVALSASTYTAHEDCIPADHEDASRAREQEQVTPALKHDRVTPNMAVHNDHHIRDGARADGEQRFVE